MFRKAVFFFLVLINFSASTTEIESVSVNINLPRYWKLVGKAEGEKESILEYIPKGQNQEKFTEKYFYKVVWNIDILPIEYYKFLIGNFEKACSDFKFTEAKHEVNEGFKVVRGNFECGRSPECEGNCNEYHGFYIIQVPTKGMILLHRIYRTDLNKFIPENIKSSWGRLFDNAKIIVKHR